MAETVNPQQVTNLDVPLSTRALEAGGELAAIKADTDKLDVNLSTRALEAGGNLALIKAKTDNLDVALSTRTKPADQQHVIIDSGSSVFAYSDSPNIDSFNRLRVSNPTHEFDGHFQYNLLPLQMESITANTGATVTHDTTNRTALMTFSSTTTGGKAYVQTYQYYRYQPGRSHLVFVTFNFIETMANTLKFAGLSDGVNGFELQQSDTTVQLKLYSGTSNGDQTVAQAAWNLDPMNGSGPSGLTLDLTKIQILVIDFQALFSGRVRMGFDIGGKIIYVHQFNHANLIAVPYIQYATLPVRCGMTCTGTVSTTMRMICSTIISEGGETDEEGVPNSVEATGTAGSGSATHFLSLRPKTTFNSLANHVEFIINSIDVLAGANPVLWQMVIGQAITGASYTDVNTTYSAFEVSTAGTLSGSPALILAQGYVGSSAAAHSSAERSLSARSPITLNQAGAVRANGTLTIILTGIGGTSVSRVTLNWKELR